MSQYTSFNSLSSPILIVHFLHANTARSANSKPHTVYEIQVAHPSSSTSWLIYKRYTHFYSLHQHLLKRAVGREGFSLSNEQKNLLLPQLPPKRLTRSLQPEFVKKRQKELERYLTELIENHSNLLQYDSEVLTFLEVPQIVRQTLSGPKISNLSRSNSASKNELYQQGRKNSGYLNTPPINLPSTASMDEKRIVECLQMISQSSSKSQLIKELKRIFFEKRPRVSNETARATLSSLLVLIGSNAAPPLISTAITALFELLDKERNKEIALWVGEYVQLYSVRNVNQARFERVLIAEWSLGPLRIQLFKLIELLIENAPNGRECVNEVLNEHIGAIQAFENWFASRTSDQNKIVEKAQLSINEQKKSNFQIPSLSANNHGKIIENTLIDLRRINDESLSRWEKVKTKITPFGNDLQFEMRYKSDQLNGLTIVHCSAVLGTGVNEMNYRFEQEPFAYLCTFLSGPVEILQRLSSNAELYKLNLKSQLNSERCIDLITLNGRTNFSSQNDPLTFVHCFTSIQFDSPNSTENNQSNCKCGGILLSSGIFLQPFNKSNYNSCRITLIISLTESTIDAFVIDLLGEKTLMKENLHLLNSPNN